MLPWVKLQQSSCCEADAYDWSVLCRCAVLCCAVLQVKIGDFGFTKRLASNTASLKVKRITHPRWVAPEVSRM
jgi:hypothetical protein